MQVFPRGILASPDAVSVVSLLIVVQVGADRGCIERVVQSVEWLFLVNSVQSAEKKHYPISLQAGST